MNADSCNTIVMKRVSSSDTLPVKIMIGHEDEVDVKEENITIHDYQHNDHLYPVSVRIDMDKSYFVSVQSCTLQTSFLVS